MDDYYYPMDYSPQPIYNDNNHDLWVYIYNHDCDETNGNIVIIRVIKVAILIHLATLLSVMVFSYIALELNRRMDLHRTTQKRLCRTAIAIMILSNLSLATAVASSSVSLLLYRCGTRLTAFYCTIMLFHVSFHLYFRRLFKAKQDEYVYRIIPSSEVELPGANVKVMPVSIV